MQCGAIQRTRVGNPIYPPAARDAPANTGHCRPAEESHGSFAARPWERLTPGKGFPPGPSMNNRPAFSHRSSYLMLVMAMVFWAGNILLGRAMNTSFTPISLSFWRWTVAALILLPFLAFPLWRKRAILLREWRSILILGLLGVAAFNWLLYRALQTTTATNTALIYAGTPIFIAFVTGVFLGEKITVRQGVGIGISSIGVAVILTRGDMDHIVGMHFQSGDLWALATVPVWGLYTIFLRSRPQELTPLELLGAIMIPGWTVLGAVFLWRHGGVAGVEWNSGTLGTVFYLAVFASILAFALWNSGVAMIGANNAGLFTHLYPLLAALLGIVFLGEVLHSFHLWGGGLIFMGLFLTSLFPTKAPRRFLFHGKAS